ncbi:MAG: DNA-invertase hin [Smithella sp. PtaU1.Bin162]|nr:MAG: DNA-invertase hin [Smithella sp. PtaU1.Bin162]
MKVALYTRVSTEDQAREGFSLTVQKNYLIEHAKAQGWEIFCSIPGCQVYEDDGYSGATMDRPALRKLLFDAKNKLFNVLIVYKQDRLTRKLKDTLAILEDLDTLGIGFRSVTEPMDTTTSAGKFALQMIGGCAEFERNRLIERIFPGMIEGVKKGHWQGARYAPYGYTYNKTTKKLEVNPAEAKIVKEIYSKYLSGKSTSQIAAHYYDMGIPSRQGGKFYTKFISDILKNKVYLGMIVWNRKRYEKKEKTKGGEGKGYKYVKNDPSKVLEIKNTHEPIITEQEFNAVQKLLDRNRNKGIVRFRNTIYYLSGVLKCNECGRTYRGHMAKVNHRTGEKRAWYHCSSKEAYYMKCSNKSVTADSVNEQVWDIIDVIHKNIDVLEEMEDVIKLSVEEPEECFIAELEEKQKLLSKNIEKQKGLYEVYSEDKINIEIYKERAGRLSNEEKKLKSDIKTIQLKILEKRNSVNVVKETQDFLVKLRSMPKDEHSDFVIKSFMRIIFKGIYIHNQEVVKVELNQPWKLCYDEGLKWIKQAENNEKTAKTEKKIRRSYVSFCVHSDVK